MYPSNRRRRWSGIKERIQKQKGKVVVTKIKTLQKKETR
jgi:hypothetical protein